MNQLRTLTLLLVGGIGAAAVADEKVVDGNHIRKNETPEPVVLAAKSRTTESKNERTIEIQLTIADQIEIYSQQEHPYLRPLKLALLDASLQPIRSTIEYPEPKTIHDESLGTDYTVYDGITKVVARYSADTSPAYVSVFYLGYNNRGFY
ncbi:MAG: protein-disulfide reductase DsbD family protein [Planctomycetaceae bacterium]